MYAYSKRRQNGLSIIELIMFIVIVGVAAAGVLQVMNLANRAGVDPVLRKQAMLIAEAYMEEVQQAQFTACDPADANAATAQNAAGCASVAENFGPEANNSRPFDNINDYVPLGYVEGQPVRAFAVADASGVLVDRDVSGAPLGAGWGNAALTNFVTTLALQRVALGGFNNSATVNDMTILLITITVTYGGGQSVVLQGYRTRYAPEAR